MVKGMKRTEIGLVPEDWEVRELGEVGAVRMCKRIFQNQTAEYGEIPFFKIGTFGKEPDAFISRKLFEEFKSKFSYPKVGDILISAAGTIGRTVVYDGEERYYQDSNIVWIDNEENIISNRLLKYVLDIVSYNTEGGTIQRLYNSILRSTKFVCPPLPEQEAIAGALTDADAWIESLEQLIAKKRLIKQGAMQELLTPKEGWEVKKLGEIAKYRRGSFPQPYGLDKWYDDTNGMPFIQVFDVGKNRKLKLETKRKISKLAQAMSVFVPKESIVLTLQGSIGRIALTQYDAYCDRTLLIFESIDYALDKFFFLLVVEQLFEIEKEKAPGGTIKTITKEALSDFDIGFPSSLSEQTRIATILSDMDADLEALEQQLHKARQIKQGMMQELLTGRVRLA